LPGNEKETGMGRVAWIVLVALALGVGTACEPVMTPAGCDNLQPGDFTCSIGTRTYLLHVPANLTRPAPLIIDAHGLGGTAQGQKSLSGWVPLSDRMGFVVIQPQGVMNRWNGTAGCCDDFGTPPNPVQDDVDFFRMIVVRTKFAGVIDAQRVIATGFSNGGAITHRIGCEAADVFAAIVPVAFSLGISDQIAQGTVAQTAAACRPAKPITMMQFHGTADTTVPFATGVVGCLGAPQSLVAWSLVNGCTDATGVARNVPPNVSCEHRTAGCAGGSSAMLCAVAGSGHNAYTPVRQQTAMSIPEIAYPRILQGIAAQLAAGNRR
jgi:polyhydroxybutyrate depolymerase